MAGGADLAVLPLCTKDVRDGTHELVSKSGRPFLTAPDGQAVCRPRSRPTGSKNKPKLPIIVTRDSANALRAHAMEVSSGCDVIESMANLARRKQRGLCALSGSGCMTNVSQRQPASSGAITTLHGRFEIISLLGSVLPPPAPQGIAGLTIYLSRAQEKVVGGIVVGMLIASGPVVIMVASLMNATFDRLPLDDNDDSLFSNSGSVISKQSPSYGCSGILRNATEVALSCRESPTRNVSLGEHARHAKELAVL